eukprot:TRINITY_DN5008_c0_g1_i1.p1 TRINITY_DN5008_c0_g1~~TRINITY_DN5008_c0_g1_i1.p1  ORF type:complete len:504 (+),score=124.78 TRINITY_DN5008_c0_g1_i1:276-1787(+)
MQKCPTCQAPAPTAEAPFCWQCGSRLAPVVPTAAPTYSSMRETMLNRTKEVIHLKDELNGVPCPVLPPPGELPPPMPVERIDVIQTGDRITGTRCREDFIFSEMDLRNKELISLDDFRCILLRCELQDIDVIDIAEMFRRADIDRDHHLSRAEFSILYNEYPNLFEIMQERIKRYWVESESLSKITAHRRTIDNLKLSEQSTHEEQITADTEATDKASRLNEAVQLAMDVEMQEKVHRSAMEAAKDESDLAKSELQEVITRHGRAQEVLRQNQLSIRDQERECDLGNRKVESHKSQLAKAEERKAELERALDTQLRDIEMITGRLERATADVEAAENRLQESRDCLKESEADLETISIKLNEAQTEVSNKDKNLHAAQLTHKESTTELERILHRKEEALSHNRWAKDRHQEFVDSNTASRRELQSSIEEEERTLQILTTTLDRQKATNRESDSDQLTVIQTEIRLKRQRRQLEEEEQSLASKVKSPTLPVDDHNYHMRRLLAF